jgi:RNA polymerase sigma factor (sigma-70 family)
MQPFLELHNNSKKYFYLTSRLNLLGLAFIKAKDETTLTDAELVQLYRTNADLNVLSNLYQRYMDLIYGICLKYLKDPEAAKDAVINIYEELIAKLKQHEVSNFKSWLYTLSRNHCLMQLRKEKGHHTVEIPETFMQTGELMHPDAVEQKEEQLNSMEKCLEQLPAEQKTCVTLFYLQGKCYNEITEQTGIEWSKVRSYIQNGRRNLKLCMDKKLQADS